MSGIGGNIGGGNLGGNIGGNSFKTGEVTPASATRGRKAGSHNKRKAGPDQKPLPDRVTALLPESALYSQLLEFESRVDSSLARKKLDIQEAIKNPPRVQRSLRIYIFNTFANQNPNPNANLPFGVLP